MPNRVDALFSANGGVATAAQLHELGFTETRLRKLIRQGKLVAVRRGAYSTAASAVARRGQASGCMRRNCQQAI